jgi:hypothetical protein
LRRIIGDEMLRQSEAQMVRGGGRLRENIERLFAFRDAVAAPICASKKRLIVEIVPA